MSQTTKLDSLELYVPEYCVQGERIPFYVLWDNDKKIQIIITIPVGVTLDEVYNVNSDNLKIENNIFTINNFESNGYFGGVLGSTLYDQASVTKKIKFEIHSDSNESQIFEKQIELFRPDVKVNDSIGIIKITRDKNNKPKVEGQIKISNHGKGTAIVRINILKESEIKEGEPEGFEEFKIKFLEDLDNVFLDMIKKFPQYDTLIESIRIISKNPLPSNADDLNKVRNMVEDLEHAFNNNEKFLTEFSHGLVIAYLKNVSIMTDADAFLAFLNSLGKNKLLILDAMKVFKVSNTQKILNAELITTDLAQNNYPSIKLRPITIISDGNYSIPFYQIIDSLDGN